MGAVCGFLGVGIGAFGAHGLKNLVPEARLVTFETGVRYQMYHAFALFAAAWAAQALSEKWAARAALWFVVGVLLFSGSLYALVLADMPKLGIITPFGGLAFLAGWACLGFAARAS